MIIYKITNNNTGKVYIGQTKMPLVRRWRVHKSSKRTCPLSSSLKKHGPEAFKIEEIARAASREELDRLEIFFIDYYKSLYPGGYNLSKGGRSNNGCGAWNKDKKTGLVPKTAFKKGHKTWNAGQQISDETRLKQSLAKLGKRVSPGTEFKPGMESAFKGRKHTPEALELISRNNGGSRGVYCPELNKDFPSMIAASRETGIDKTSLQELVRSGKIHKRTGLSFKLKEDPK